MSPHNDEEALSSPERRALAGLPTVAELAAPDAIDTLPAVATHATHAVLNAAPTLEEIIQLTRHELSTAQDDDSIVECGRAALSLLRTNPDLAVKLAYQKLHDVPYKEVKTCWRRLYTDATLRRVLRLTEGRGKRAHTNEAWLDEVVKMLDMALVLTAAPTREELVELWFMALEEHLSAHELANAAPEPLERPAKKLKLDNATSTPSTFPAATIEPPLTLRHPILRCETLSLSAFQNKLSTPATHYPLIIPNAIQHWPALSERPWNDPNYLLKRTLGGRRLVPIETGRSYTDSGWGQKIITFASFMNTYMLNPSISDSRDTGYLAQHDLFTQVPSLRSDICIPDYCYSSPSPCLPSNITPTPKLEDVLLNAWFGPKGTISPLHTDPYHNILAQVVGYKYVRCYRPEMTEYMWPRGREGGVDMGNTSAVDLDEAMGLWPEIRVEGLEIGGEGERGFEQERMFERDVGGRFGQDGQEKMEQRRRFEERFPGFKEAEYVEGVLGPGECLYLPPGWWHYVRSLSPSFSVSFWFN